MEQDKATHLKDRIAEIDEMLEHHASSLQALRLGKGKLVLRLADTIGDDELDTDRARIARLVPAATGISWGRITGKQRAQEVVNARWLAMHMLYQRGYSLSEIGRLLGKDHTTVLHARDSWNTFYCDPKNADFAKLASATWHQFYRERI